MSMSHFCLPYLTYLQVSLIDLWLYLYQTWSPEMSSKLFGSKSPPLSYMQHLHRDHIQFTCGLSFSSIAFSFACTRYIALTECLFLYLLLQMCFAFSDSLMALSHVISLNFNLRNFKAWWLWLHKNRIFARLSLKWLTRYKFTVISAGRILWLEQLFTL